MKFTVFYVNAEVSIAAHQAFTLLMLAEYSNNKKA